MPEKNKKTDINSVAKEAGVSITTVSRVINKVPTVNKENRRKVEEAVKKLGYKPSLIAQSLASGKRNTIALVIPRYEGVFYSFYVMELLRGVGTLCDVLRLDLLLHLTDGKTGLNTQFAGGVIFSDVIGNSQQIKDVLAENIPCIVINNYPEDLNVNCIAIDNAQGARLAVDYLIGLGHKKIAHITGDTVTQAARQRLEGYKKSLEKHKIEIKENYILGANYSRASAREAAEKILTMDDRPTAIFAASDDMALEVMAVFMENGLKIPKDISIIGFDDDPKGLYGPVALTTIRQPLVKMAQDSVKAIDLLIKTNQSQVKKIKLPAELVIRESCRQIK